MAQSQFPTFSTVEPSQIESTLQTMLATHLKAIDAKVESTPAPTYENFITPLDKLDIELDNFWSPISHLNSVADTPELRAAYQASLSHLSEFGTTIGQHKGLYQAYQAIADAPEFDTLSAAKQMTVTHALRGFKLSGVHLPEDTQQTIKSLSQELTQACQTFENHVLDATQAFKHPVSDASELAGLPEWVLSHAKQVADEHEHISTPYALTLDPPIYLAVMQHAQSAALRETLYKAFVTRASNEGPHDAQYDNAPVITEILSLRQQLAQLLGFNNYAEKSLVPKMLTQPKEVLAFLTELLEKAQPQAKAEFAELSEFAAAQGHQGELAPWDIAFYREQLSQSKFSVTQEALRPYFPLPKVLDGIFTVWKEVFGIETTAMPLPDTWHSDVTLYAVKDRNGNRRGYFYVDLYPRTGKRGGAWMADARTRFLREAIEQYPVAFVNANFAPPVDGKPACLTHDEVLTLWHELGHCLHHVLTLVDEPAVSGISGVPWDAVELPSQFFESFMYEPELIKRVSGHVDSGEPLPDELIDSVIALRQFHQGSFLLRQLEFALFDMNIHLDPSLSNAEAVHNWLSAWRNEHAVGPKYPNNYFENSFSHIFAGGYAAGYYSYLWAEVLALDAFAAFLEVEPSEWPTLGERFVDEILSKGGSVHPSDAFKAFRGRAPQINALLKAYGIN